MLGQESKQYYKGTTTDIVAILEVGNDAKFFFTSEIFWTGFLASMQVDSTNYGSNCI